ncbi:MAG TPA: clostripain-related cysteine peptidase [Pyrinomonadaceae bacterium]
MPKKVTRKKVSPKVGAAYNKAPNEWTLMFFFAGDNQLSPSMISELKAIKDAGFQLDTAVLAHFDPNEIGAPTRVFNVNQARKQDATTSRIGDDKDPFVRNLNEDDVKPDTIDTYAGIASKRIKKGLEEPDTLDVREALTLFLGFCRENHRAKHYMLFLVGHGMIVGSDAFLPDDHVIVKKNSPFPGDKIIADSDKLSPGELPITALSLKQLEEVVRGFSEQVKEQGDEFELLALHSCSMSAIEVAYQLKDTANYMMATEGVSFVGSWPYRQLLKKTFNTVEAAKKKDSDVDVPELMSDLYFLSLHNGTDFLSAGYSSDLALCRLRAGEVGELTEPLKRLVAALKRGLEAGSRNLKKRERDERVKDLILLAHWKAQSFWQENYTDLFDFCLCLSKSCDANDELQEAIRDACDDVTRRIGALVVHSDHFGSKYQYAHGLSVYFPWSKAVEDEDNGILKRYEEEYAFTGELGEDSWFSFLEMYFTETQRDTRAKEEGVRNEEQRSGFAAAREFAKPFGSLSRVKPSPELSGGGGKPSPEVGAVCSCVSIKNYPEETQPLEFQGRQKRNVKAFSISEGALRAFK